MSGLVGTGQFVAVFPALVRSLGSMEAAAVVQYVAYRQPDDGTPVRLRVADFVEATGLSETTVKRHTRALADKGALTKHQAGRNAIVAYAVNRDHPALRGSDRSPDGAEVAPSQAGTPSSSSVARTQEPAELGGMLPIMVGAVIPQVEDGPPKTAQTLVGRWCDGYRAANDGQDAPGPVMKRVAGQAKNLARGCESTDDWRAAWHASYAAGQCGRPDAVPFMVTAKSQFRPGPRNALLDPHLMDTLPALPGLSMGGGR